MNINKLLLIASLTTISLNADHASRTAPYLHQHVTPVVQPVTAQPEEPNTIKRHRLLRAKQAQESKASFMSEVPEAVIPKIKMQTEALAYDHAESFEEKDFKSESPICKIEALEIDPVVKKAVIKILKKSQNNNQTHLQEIITNQRIMILLLSAIAAKLVIYDIYMERMAKEEGK